MYVYVLSMYLMYVIIDDELTRKFQTTRVAIINKFIWMRLCKEQKENLKYLPQHWKATVLYRAIN